MSSGVKSIPNRGDSTAIWTGGERSTKGRKNAVLSPGQKRGKKRILRKKDIGRVNFAYLNEDAC